MEYRWFCFSHIDLHKWLILLTTYFIGTTVSLSPKWLNQNKKHFFLKSCKQAVTVCMRIWFKWVIIDYNRNSLVAGTFLFSFLMHCLLLSEKICFSWIVPNSSSEKASAISYPSWFRFGWCAITDSTGRHGCVDSHSMSPFLWLWALC